VAKHDRHDNEVEYSLSETPHQARMSADNFLSLREINDGRGRVYVLAEYEAEGQLINPIGTFRGLRQAMIAAEEYQQDVDVEYGVRFSPLIAD
jgi:hypothetical protein